MRQSPSYKAVALTYVRHNQITCEFLQLNSTELCYSGHPHNQKILKGAIVEISAMSFFS